MSQNPRPGDLSRVELTLTENQIHDVLGGLAKGANYYEHKEMKDIAREMRATRDVVVEQFNDDSCETNNEELQ